MLLHDTTKNLLGLLCSTTAFALLSPLPFDPHHHYWQYSLSRHWKYWLRSLDGAIELMQPSTSVVMLPSCYQALVALCYRYLHGGGSLPQTGSTLSLLFSYGRLSSPLIILISLLWMLSSLFACFYSMEGSRGHYCCPFPPAPPVTWALSELKFALLKSKTFGLVLTFSMPSWIPNSTILWSL